MRDPTRIHAGMQLLIATLVIASIVGATLGAPSRAVAAVPAVADWRFDDGSGATVSDHTGRYDGTVGGNATWTDGICGDGAMDFLDAAHNCIVEDIPSAFDDSLAVTNKFTVAAWVKRTGTGNPSGRYYYILDARDIYSGDELDGGFILFVDTDEIPRFNLGRSGDSNDVYLYGDSKRPLRMDTWYHVAVVFDGVAQSLYLYVNGIKTATVTGAGSAYDGTDLTAAIGNNRWAPSDSKWSEFKGIIEDVKVYKTALTGLEIKELMAQCPTASIPTLNEWGTLVLVVVLLGAGLLALRRRQKAAA